MKALCNLWNILFVVIYDMNMYVILNKQNVSCLSKEPGMVGSHLWVWGQPGIRCVFEASQDYTERPCLKKMKEARGQQYGSVSKPDNLSLLSRNAYFVCAGRNQLLKTVLWLLRTPNKYFPNIFKEGSQVWRHSPTSLALERLGQENQEIKAQNLTR